MELLVRFVKAFDHQNNSNFYKIVGQNEHLFFCCPKATKLKLRLALAMSVD
jgi:hypothetical protein